MILSVTFQEIHDAIRAPYNRMRRPKEDPREIFRRVLAERVPIEGSARSATKREIILKNLLKLVGNCNSRAIRLLDDFLSKEGSARSAERSAELSVDQRIIAAAHLAVKEEKDAAAQGESQPFDRPGNPIDSQDTQDSGSIFFNLLNEEVPFQNATINRLEMTIRDRIDAALEGKAKAVLQAFESMRDFGLVHEPGGPDNEGNLLSAAIRECAALQKQALIDYRKEYARDKKAKAARAAKTARDTAGRRAKRASQAAAAAEAEAKKAETETNSSRAAHAGDDNGQVFDLGMHNGGVRHQPLTNPKMG